MKKIFTLFLALLMFVGIASAQQPRPHDGPGRPPKIEEVVNDLSARQKRQLENISQESKARMQKYNVELKHVRDSIYAYIRMSGDHSAKLFPLFEREGHIKAMMSKETYRTRVKIDKVLTKEQRKELSDAMAKNHKPHPKK